MDQDVFFHLLFAPFEVHAGGLGNPHNCLVLQQPTHIIQNEHYTTGEEISVKKQTSGVGKEGVLGWKVVGGGRAEVEGKAEVD